MSERTVESNGARGSAHLVWDWNGTLFDDLDLNCACLSLALARHRSAVSVSDYHALFAHPVRTFYDALVGRAMTDLEWAEAQETFHSAYLREVDKVSLAPGALDAMARWNAAGHSQSVLSMWSQEPLQAAVLRRGVDRWCTFVEGRTDSTIDRKALLMKAHLDRAEHIDARAVVVVGDSVDDALAADHVGAMAILHSGGLTGRATLERSGFPVVDSIEEAVELALRLVAPQVAR